MSSNIVLARVFLGELQQKRALIKAATQEDFDKPDDDNLWEMFGKPPKRGSEFQKVLYLSCALRLLGIQATRVSTAICYDARIRILILYAEKTNACIIISAPAYDQHILVVKI